MNREDKSYRILELLGRPKGRRDLGMSNLAKMKERELDILLAELEVDTATMVNALSDWLKPDAKHRLFDTEIKGHDDNENPKRRRPAQDH